MVVVCYCDVGGIGSYSRVILILMCDRRKGLVGYKSVHGYFEG